MTRGTLRDTYVAALQHDLVDLPDQAALVGVVRSPMPWFAPAVDENHPALGPPQTLLERIKQRAEELEADGLDDAEAHNTAWDDVDFERRYREHLHTNDEAQTAFEALRTRLLDGEDLVLVCYENTEMKRCHRTILREELADAL